jgi:glycerol-3-phosphate acyltransferase PlsY
MMSVLVVLLGYLLGSLPMGYFIIKLIHNRDITKFGSGRTGGTNAARAGGTFAGILTGVLDFLKGYAAVWLASRLMPGDHLVEALAGAAAVLGHNWSLILFFFTKKFSAGAGTGPNIGAATAMWLPVVFIEVPVIAFFVFVVGYASVASLVAALALILIFVLRFLLVGAPWEYILFSCITAVLVITALLPNLKRLVQGTERRVGLAAKKN